jgi:tellurite resistance protein TehA-like permease
MDEGLPIGHCSSRSSSPENPLEQWIFSYNCLSPYIRMSGQVGLTDEQVQYEKNAVLFDGRRDSRIRGSIGATLERFSKRRSTFINKFDRRTAIQDSTSRRSPQSDTMVYPQISRPQYYEKEDEILGRELRDKNDLKIQTLSLHDEKEEATAGNTTLKDRLKHFTFAWYACTMSTGGVAFVLSVIPSRFDGLTQLGSGIFVFNLFLCTAVTITMCVRFYVHPVTFTHSMTNPHEGFFFATFWLSLATMITNTTAYGIPNSGPWLLVALRYAFWAYTVCATLLAILYYHVLFTIKKLVITNVLPGWVLPIFPAMLVGTPASAIARTQLADQAMFILVAGLSYQGLGFFVALMMYGIYFGRLLTSGLPIDMSRPAMFIAVGPPSFTALAFIGMAQDVTAT